MSLPLQIMPGVNLCGEIPSIVAFKAVSEQKNQYIGGRYAFEQRKPTAPANDYASNAEFKYTKNYLPTLYGHIRYL